MFRHLMYIRSANLLYGSLSNTWIEFLKGRVIRSQEREKQLKK